MKIKTQVNRKAEEMVAQLDAFRRRLLLREKIVRYHGPPLARQERRIVRVIGEQQDCTMSELSQRTLLAMSSLTSVVDKLVAKHQVERKRFDEDRRVVRVRLSQLGRERYEHFRRKRLYIANSMLSALNAVEQETFLKLMRKIGRGVSEMDRSVKGRGK